MTKTHVAKWCHRKPMRQSQSKESPERFIFNHAVLWTWCNITNSITMTSQEHSGIPNHRQPDYLFNQEIIESSYNWPLWGTSTGERWIIEEYPSFSEGFPSQRTNGAENISMTSLPRVLCCRFAPVSLFYVYSIHPGIYVCMFPIVQIIRHPSFTGADTTIHIQTQHPR